MTSIAGRGLYPNYGARRTSRRNSTGLNGTAAPGPIPLPTQMIAEYAFDPTTDFPDLITEISPTTDPLDLPLWSRLHDTHRGVNRLLSLTTDTGRQHETDVFQPGTADHQFDNHDRVLDPKYTDGAYYGHLDPGNRIRDRAVWGSRTHELYTGFAQGYQQRYQPPAGAQVDVAATDLLDIINGHDAPLSPYAAEVFGEPGLRAWWRFGESEGLIAADSSPNGYDGDLRYTPTFGQTALVNGDPTTSMSFPGVSGALMPSDAAVIGTQWTIEAVMSHGAASGDYDAMVQMLGAATVGYLVDLYMNSTGHLFVQVNVPTGLACIFATTPAYDDNLVHLVRLTRDNQVYSVYVDGAFVTSAVGPDNAAPAAGSYIAVGVGMAPNNSNRSWSGLLQDVSFYDQALGGDNAARHYAAFATQWSGDTTGQRAHRVANLVGILETERSIDAGLTTMGVASLSGSDLGYLQLIEATEQGQLLVDHENGAQLRLTDRYRRILDTFSTVPQAVFTDDPASTTGYRYEPDNLAVTRDKQLIFNDVTVTWSGGSVRTQDPTSRKRHGRRPRTITTDLPTVNQARALGRWFLSHYKDPIDRILSLTLKPSADKRLFDPALGLKTGHLVTVEMQPQGIGNRSSQNVIVEGKHWQWGTGVNEATCVLYVSNADVRSYFRPGVSSPDGTDGPAY